MFRRQKRSGLLHLSNSWCINLVVGTLLTDRIKANNLQRNTHSVFVGALQYRAKQSTNCARLKKIYNLVQIAEQKIFGIRSENGRPSAADFSSAHVNPVLYTDSVPLAREIKSVLLPKSSSRSRISILHIGSTMLENHQPGPGYQLGPTGKPSNRSQTSTRSCSRVIKQVPHILAQPCWKAGPAYQLSLPRKASNRSRISTNHIGSTPLESHQASPAHHLCPNQNHQAGPSLQSSPAQNSSSPLMPTILVSRESSQPGPP